MTDPGEVRRRGRLRVYMGAAPGVGKTYEALEEAHRLRSQGVDVVVGYVETHGRADTAAMVGDLEVVPRQTVVYRDRPFEDMDLAAVLTRRPQVALVDELAHSNVPGVRNEKRWEDVEELLAAGVDVISTLNIQHLESLNDVVAEITGVVQGETIPDEIVRRADELELVDLTQEGVRARMAAGKIYPADRIDAALANFFRPGNLGALRELALSWTAERVDEAVERYRRLQGIEDQWETRERVVVGITGAAGGDTVIRRAARIAMRSRGDFLGVHVRETSGIREATPELEAQQELSRELGGTYLEVTAERTGEALVDVARAQNATQLVIGASRRSRWEQLTRGSIVGDVLRTAGPLDVHVISNPAARPLRRRLQPRTLPMRRLLLAWATVALGVPLATALMLELREDIGLENVLLVYLVLAVAAAWIGGLWPAVAAGVVSFLAANWFFTTPFDTLSIRRGQDLFALAAYVVVTVGSGILVSQTARRTAQAAQAQAEASMLVDLVKASGEETLDELAARLCDATPATGVSVFVSEGAMWDLVACAGEHPPADPYRAARVEPFAGAVLALNGGPLTPADERTIQVFQLLFTARLRLGRLQAEAEEMSSLSQGDQLRTALLRAVSHDLRSPLAAIKASVTSLSAGDVEWSAAETGEFLDTIETQTLRLERIVDDLLDAGRLQSGGVHVSFADVALEDVVAGALSGMRDELAAVDADIDERLPLVRTDAALLERVIENLVRNAVAFSPDGARVTVSAGTVGKRVDLRVVDHGPGIPQGERDLVFQPFRRLGDSRPGVGLGLTVAKGLADVLGHSLVVDDTPGGGTTMVLSMDAAT